MLKRKDFLNLTRQAKKKGTKSVPYSVPYEYLTVDECRIISINRFNIECDGNKRLCNLKPI